MTPKTIEKISFTPQICENIRISITPADFARCVLDYIMTKLCIVCNICEQFIKTKHFECEHTPKWNE